MRALIQCCLGVVLLCGFATSHTLAQTFSSGSDGSDGAINITTDTILDLPPDGIFHATTITVAAGATLRFNRNAFNTPVYLLATGDITVMGRIDISGVEGSVSAGGLGGPGGFNGGSPAVGGLPPGDGFGPGAGQGQIQESDPRGRATYGEALTFPTPFDGEPYGNPLLIPLLSGSGGGGQFSVGGGGGGGAMLLASSTRVHIPNPGFVIGRGGVVGSAGAIRIVAPVVSGDGILDVERTSSGGGQGRIRIDTLDRAALNFRIVRGVASIGSFLVVFPDTIPRLDIIAAAGRTIDAGTGNAVSILLPFNAPTTQTVTVQARDFAGIVPINVVLTPESGRRTMIPVEIDMDTGNPATVDVSVELPVNVVTHVHVWTR